MAIRGSIDWLVGISSANPKIKVDLGLRFLRLRINVFFANGFSKSCLKDGVA
jgi:hypothetical protein